MLSRCKRKIPHWSFKFKLTVYTQYKQILQNIFKQSEATGWPSSSDFCGRERGAAWRPQRKHLIPPTRWMLSCRAETSQLSCWFSLKKKNGCSFVVFHVYPQQQQLSCLHSDSNVSIRPVREWKPTAADCTEPRLWNVKTAWCFCDLLGRKSLLRLDRASCQVPDDSNQSEPIISRVTSMMSWIYRRMKGTMTVKKRHIGLLHPYSVAPDSICLTDWIGESLKRGKS